MFCYYMCYDMYKIASPTLFLPLNKPPMISNKQLCLGSVFKEKESSFLLYVVALDAKPTKPLHIMA